MTAPDLTQVANQMLTYALSQYPGTSLDDGQWWSLSDDGAGGAILWHIDAATNEWTEVARVSLTVDVKPLSSVVVNGVYTGKEGVAS